MKPQQRIQKGASRQRGITLLEVVTSISLMAAVIAGLAQMGNRYTTDLNNSTVAQQLKRIGSASQKYIADNYATISSTATSTQPYLVTVPMLVAGGYLPSASTGTNSYGQTLCTLVIQPSANTLQGMLVTEGGTTIGDPDLGAIVQYAGGSSGAVRTATPTSILGAMGGWSLLTSAYHNLVNNSGKKCDGTTAGNVQLTAGHPTMALWFENGAQQAPTLYRTAVPGNTALNTMTTPILMSSVQTLGAACSPNGAIATTSTGQVVSCTSGVWASPGGGSQYWKDPVANYASLPASGNNVGDTRITKDTNRAFIWTGGAWSAISVDQNGNMTIPGTVTAANGRVISWNQAAEGGVVQLVGNNGQNIYIENNNGNFRLINSGWNGQLFNVDQNGYVFSNSGMIAGGTITANAGNNTGMNPYSNGWAMITGDGANSQNAAAQSAAGSLHVNDIYVRSIGKWVSQIQPNQGWWVCMGGRGLNTWFSNTTGAPIKIAVTMSASASNPIAYFQVNGSTIGQSQQMTGGAGWYQYIYGEVPNGASYAVAASNENLVCWSELR